MDIDAKSCELRRTGMPPLADTAAGTTVIEAGVADDAEEGALAAATGMIPAAMVPGQKGGQVIAAPRSGGAP